MLKSEDTLSAKIFFVKFPASLLLRISVVLPTCFLSQNGLLILTVWARVAQNCGQTTGTSTVLIAAMGRIGCMTIVFGIT